MSKYKTYPEYKDSGVEWLGEIPSHWELKKLKYLCNIKTGDKDTVNAVEDGRYPFYVRSPHIERINSYTFDCEAVLTAGDGAGVGKIYHYVNGKFGCHQRVYALTNFSQILGQFIYYYLSANFYKVALEGNAKSTVDSLRLPQFLNFEITFPDEIIQKQIINFLDHETAKIDQLIEKQQSLIELLKEKRQAVISHAVTKGLDPNVKMKDSGVEWLGEVPEHWKVKALKYIFKLNPSKSELTETIFNEKCSFIPMEKLKLNILELDETRMIKDVYNGYTYFKNNDLLMAKVTPCFENKNMVVARNLLNNIGFGSTEIYVMRMNKYYCPDYLYYRLQENIFTQLAISNMSGAGGLKRVPSEFLNSYLVAIPSINEQQKIVIYLNEQASKIDLLIQKAKQQIELMKERRTALISAAVTGKIDVRDWQPEQ
ncbi:restriction endonuclease subunit S [Wohlfahrtiimonas chitiniclastica]|uniref:restriction endonuclease subunit S n=1 Tax=Wohlfahrtiimonas chitiniclastica TaxID=400946 RepID=UPI003CCFEC29